MAKYFEDIAKRFGLIGPLVQQTFKSGAARNEAKRVEGLLQERLQAPKPTPQAGFFADIAEKYRLNVPLPKKVENKVPGLQEFATGFRGFSLKLPEVTDKTLNLPGDVVQEQIEQRAPKDSLLGRAAPAIGLGINVLTPGPGEWFREGKLTEKAFEKIAAETSPEEIRKVLKAGKVPDEVVPVLSEKLVEVGDPKQARSIIDDTLSRYEKGLDGPDPLEIERQFRPRPGAVQRAADELEEESARRLARRNPEIEREMNESLDALLADVEKAEERMRALNATPRTPARTFGQSIRDSLEPIRATDDETQGIFRRWVRENVLAKEKANAELGKIGVRNKEGIDIITRYERGSGTAYTGKIRQLFDDLYEEAKKRGVDLGYRPNYLPHLYKESPEEIRAVVSKYMLRKGVPKEIVDEYLKGSGVLPNDVARRLKLNASFTKERIFPTYQDAIDAGLSPRFTNPDQLLAYYRHELEKSVANRKFIEDLVAKAKLATADEAPEGWVPVNLNFAPKGYYASPALAKTLNGLFPDEGNLSFGARLLKGAGWASRRAQEVVLSAGAPKTDINFFAIGQLIKEIVSGNLKSIPAFVRANSSARTIRYFQDNALVLRKMANQGIDLGARTGEYSTLYKSLVDQRPAAKRIAEALGRGWDQAFNKATFSSFMPQLQVDAFKAALTKGIRKGMTPEEAEKFAGDVVKNAFGLLENVGRGVGTEDALSAIFFAPKFREGIIRTLANTGRSVTTQAFNPAFYRNRRLFTGLVLTYGIYNVANKKLTGHYMWENPPGNEFDLMIPMENGDNVFIGYMPSFFAFARNMASGVIATVRGDFGTATQKFGSVFSIPIKITSEVLSNRDYFGREIYKDTDSGTDKLKKIAEYVGLQVNHPYIRSLYRQREKVFGLENSDPRPIYQSVSEALELPLKFKSDDQITRNQFYAAMDKQEQLRADARKRLQPIYDKVQALKKAGNAADAQEIVDGLSPEDYETYKNIRAADKRRQTMRGEADMFDTVMLVRDLKAQGKNAEAQAIVDAMSEEEYRLYSLAKKKLP